MNTNEYLEQQLLASLDTGIDLIAGPFFLEKYSDGGDPDEKCAALLGTSAGMLIVKAAAYDSFTHNRAVADNERTWSLGDVIEFFVQFPGHEDYYEFHVTPECKRLQLHLTDYKKLREASFESRFCECGLVVQSRVSDEVWVSEMRIPLSSLEVNTASGMRFAVCRYNYGRAGSPCLSSFPALDSSYGFHNPPAWAVIGMME